MAGNRRAHLGEFEIKPGARQRRLAGGERALRGDGERRQAVGFFLRNRPLRQQALVSENRALKRALDTRYGLDSIVGSDARMLRIYDLIEAVAPTRTTVLMTGESGTGKSLIAHAIHHRSGRRDKP
ncbi:MAG TPA: sigma 54-interacting transcriptional regulator, partial [Plasticicumulans sp.]|nr:sigma 54-interacting transcriptional regulator [Plasticicumulans sp.]